MPATYEPIQTYTLGSASSTINFTSIPATYTDLRLILVFAGAGNTVAQMKLNNDATALYSATMLLGDGSTASTTVYTSQNDFGGESGYMTNGVWGLWDLNIFSYTSSQYKNMFLTKSFTNPSGTPLRSIIQSGVYRSTNAITQINIMSGGVQFQAGTSATLYGILKA